MLAVIDTWLEIERKRRRHCVELLPRRFAWNHRSFRLVDWWRICCSEESVPRVLRLCNFSSAERRLLNDVKRGLKGSGSAESVNRLAVIMLLTLSIVTLAAVQGYTGTLVDEKTVDATVGSDLQVTLEQPYNEAQVLELVEQLYRRKRHTNCHHGSDVFSSTM